jgi:hypothetical protein
MGFLPVDAALHQFRNVQGPGGNTGAQLKCFILLHIGGALHCDCNPLVQCTKIFLTGRMPLPRIEMLRRTIHKIHKEVDARPEPQPLTARGHASWQLL